MTIESEYQRAKATLRHINSKITPEARERCAAHTLADQLAQLRTIHAVELAVLQKRQSQDQSDVETAFMADASWSGQHARLNPKGWEQTDA